MEDVLQPFHPAVSAWFRESFPEPSAAQRLGWPSIAEGKHTLILAPTGSGKTLAAFLWCLNKLYLEPGSGVQVLYVSPLKALNYDVHKNLEVPLAGIVEAGRRLGYELPEIRTAVRTGDTATSDRASMIRRPPHILITTPESLYLLLTSIRGREMLRSVRYLILDEIHAVAATKRGVHLALSVQRLEALGQGGRTGDQAPAAGTDRKQRDGNPAGPGPGRPAAGHRLVRIGLSATQRPLSEIASFLGGVGRDVNVVDAGMRKELDLAVVSPVETFKELPNQSSWNGVYQKLLGYMRIDGVRDRSWPGPSARLYTGADPHPHPRPLPEREGNHRLPEEEGRAQAGGGVEPKGARGDARLGARDSDLRSVLIFVNNRGVAERVTAHLNDLAGTEMARAHHGSLSKEKRRDVEGALKRGELKAIVATSSLELGIDMGSIDLVVQIGSPKSVARGLQRIGRAGHTLSEPSSGRVLPTFRSELVESAVLAREMHEANVEETRVPRNCLDVLAQQICAMAAVDEWHVPELFDLVRKAYPYRDLTRAALDGVLEMLSGRYPSTEFGELRPRIAWDRVQDRIRARDGSRMLAIVNGGTIPDRGYFGVYLAENLVKLGELDEEMVFESRVGDVFILGNRNWRIDAIGHDRLLVSPAPPGPARMPFWHGDAPGRPYVLGQLIARFLGDAEAQLDDPALPARLAHDCDLDELAAANLIEFLEDQRDWVGGLPSLGRIIVERFADELGEPRVVIHSPFGKRVNGAWALALVGLLRQTVGLEVEYIYTDDGIALRFPPGAEPPGNLLKALNSANVEDLLVDELANSAMFGSVFRENAARSLLLPRQAPSRRSPLWLQRIKAADLLQVAHKYDSFPVIIETYRECLQDILDVQSLKGLLVQIETGEIQLVDVATDRPSPFAAELLFSFVGAFMYATDAPRAERTTAMLALNRDLLAEVLDAKAMRELLEPAAIEQLEGRLQRTLPGWKAESADDLMEIFLRLVDLTEAEVAERCEGDAPALLRELVEGRQIVRVRSAECRVPTSECPVPSSGSDGGPEGATAQFIPAEYADWFGQAIEVRAGASQSEVAGADPALGARHAAPDPRLDLVQRFAANHGPFRAETLRRRYGFDPAPELEELVGRRVLARGAFTPGQTGEEWCLVENLRQLHRQTLSILREQIEPRDPAQYAAFLAEWQHLAPPTRESRVQSPEVSRGRLEARGPAWDARPETRDPRLTGVAGLRRIIGQLQGIPLPMEIWEPEVLYRRLAGYQPVWLDQLCASGEIVWIGCTTPGGGKGKIAFYFRDELEVLLPPEGPPRTLSEAAERVRDWLHSRGASFLQTIAAGTGLSYPQTYDALWELVWAGEATNDTFDPVRSPRRPQPQSGRMGFPPDASHSTLGIRHPSLRRWSYRRDFRRPGAQLPAGQGRWSLVASNQLAPQEEQAEAYARQLLARYGVVAREMALAEEGPVSWAAVYAVLKRLEAIGQARRGYFVKGLSGAQFALPDAVEQLRKPRQQRILLNAADPANPYGAVFGFDGSRRITRLASNHLVLINGQPALGIEGQGSDLVPLGPPARDALPLLPAILAVTAQLRRIRRLEVETWDGQPILTSPVRDDLAQLGFEPDPRRMILRPNRL